MLRHLKFETGRDDAKELIQLLLVIQIALSEHHEVSDTALQMLG